MQGSPAPVLRPFQQVDRAHFDLVCRSDHERVHRQHQIVNLTPVDVRRVQCAGEQVVLHHLGHRAFKVLNLSDVDLFLRVVRLRLPDCLDALPDQFRVNESLGRQCHSPLNHFLPGLHGLCRVDDALEQVVAITVKVPDVERVAPALHRLVHVMHHRHRQVLDTHLRIGDIRPVAEVYLLNFVLFKHAAIQHIHAVLHLRERLLGQIFLHVSVQRQLLTLNVLAFVVHAVPEQVAHCVLKLFVQVCRGRVGRVDLAVHQVERLNQRVQFRVHLRQARHGGGAFGQILQLRRGLRHGFRIGRLFGRVRRCVIPRLRQIVGFILGLNSDDSRADGAGERSRIPAHVVRRVQRSFHRQRLGPGVVGRHCNQRPHARPHPHVHGGVGGRHVPALVIKQIAEYHRPRAGVKTRHLGRAEGRGTNQAVDFIGRFKLQVQIVQQIFVNGRNAALKISDGLLLRRGDQPRLPGIGEVQQVVGTHGIHARNGHAVHVPDVAPAHHLVGGTHPGDGLHVVGDVEGYVALHTNALHDVYALVVPVEGELRAHQVCQIHQRVVGGRARVLGERAHLFTGRRAFRVGHGVIQHHGQIAHAAVAHVHRAALVQPRRVGVQRLVREERIRPGHGVVRVVVHGIAVNVIARHGVVLPDDRHVDGIRHHVVLVGCGRLPQLQLHVGGRRGVVSGAGRVLPQLVLDVLRPRRQRGGKPRRGGKLCPRSIEEVPFRAAHVGPGKRQCLPRKGRNLHVIDGAIGVGLRGVLRRAVVRVQVSLLDQPVAQVLAVGFDVDARVLPAVCRVPGGRAAGL